MSLISCPDCGGQISRRAQTCPHCGRPLQALPNRRSNPVLWRTALILILLIALLWAPPEALEHLENKHFLIILLLLLAL